MKLCIHSERDFLKHLNTGNLEVRGRQESFNRIPVERTRWCQNEAKIDYNSSLTCLPPDQLSIRLPVLSHVCGFELSTSSEPGIC